MKTPINQAGIGHLAAVFVILFLAVAGFAGYKVVTMNRTASVAPASTAASTAKAPASINNKADLTQASKALDDSSSQVDSSLNDNALNSDLNDLL